MVSDLLSSIKAEEFVGNTKIRACISLELGGCLLGFFRMLVLDLGI